MIAPPTHSHLNRHTKDCNTWVEFQNMQSMLDPQEIVDDCEEIYQDAYRDVAKRDRDGLVLSDLQQDLAKMSNQSAIRYDFRRFVIIKSTTDVYGRPGEEEWVSNSRASFHYCPAEISDIFSASGNWFLSSGLGTRLIPKTSGDRYYCNAYDGSEGLRTGSLGLCVVT